MTPLEGEIALTKAVMRSIEHTTGSAPRKRSWLSTFVDLSGYTAFVLIIIALSVYMEK